VFTQYLAFSTSSWANKVGFGISITCPEVSGGVSANGNSGMLRTVQQTPYSIAYIGISFHSEGLKNSIYFSSAPPGPRRSTFYWASVARRNLLKSSCWSAAVID
jgi:hypothetical protein